LCKPKLEAEARLEIDNTRSQRTGRLAKAPRADVGVDRAGVDIQQVKNVQWPARYFVPE
jgi:hypothetical protein